ncbi:Putative cysteine synthase A CysK2 OS=Streptomyces microflavus OX=1919 GN=Smic_07990 PE=4 SV=1 [Streptomyces microflavus]
MTVFPDGPQRYIGTVFDNAYCREHNLLGHLPADEPDEIAHSGDRVVSRWTRCTHVTDPLALDALLLAEAAR